MTCPYNVVFTTLAEKYRPKYRLLIATSFPLNIGNYVNVYETGACSGLSVNGTNLEQVYWHVVYPQRDLL